MYQRVLNFHVMTLQDIFVLTRMITCTLTRTHVILAEIEKTLITHETYVVLSQSQGRVFDDKIKYGVGPFLPSMY